MIFEHPECFHEQNQTSLVLDILIPQFGEVGIQTVCVFPNGPMSLIPWSLYQERFRLRLSRPILCIDSDPRSIDLAGKILEVAIPVPQRAMTFVHADITWRETPALAAMDVVFVTWSMATKCDSWRGSLLSSTRQMRPGAYVAVRTARNWQCLLYPVRVLLTELIVCLD